MSQSEQRYDIHGITVKYDWKATYPFLQPTKQESLMLCVAEANEKYRHGSSPLKDNEYDFLLDQVEDPDFKYKVGTEMDVTSVLKAIHERRVVEEWPTYYPVVDHGPHHSERLRVWDAEEGKMDYDVIVQGNNILLPGDNDDIANYKAGTLDWPVEELAVIQGLPYYVMPLDQGFELMRHTGLTDTEGHDLWQGDIIKLPDGILAKIKWCTVMHYWCITQCDDALYEYRQGRPLFNAAPVSTKVGNIRENPHVWLKRKAAFKQATIKPKTKEENPAL